MKPNAIPVATLKVKGIIIIVTKEGMTISSRFQLICLTSVAINAPTIISAGAVTSGVITDKMGEKNKAMEKQMAITIDVNPVLPPTATPAEDSTNDAVVEVPNIAPATPDAESARRALPAFGI